TLLFFLAVITLVTGVGWVASVHFRRPAPTAIDGGLVLSFSGSLSGLGNADVFINLSATAEPTATCTTPAGSNESPGQNPASVNVTGSIAIPASEIKNGNLTF